MKDVTAGKSDEWLRRYRNALDAKSGDLAGLLAILFGPLGVHKFYLGQHLMGVIMLLLTLTLVGLIVTIPWCLIDGIRFITSSKEDFAIKFVDPYLKEAD